jgi:hypothetical protein
MARRGSKNLSHQATLGMSKEKPVPGSAREEKWPPLSELIYVPKNPQDRLAMGCQIETGLVLKFRETLSQDENSMMDSAPANWLDMPKYRTLLARFDDFILREMRLLGWRLLLTDIVLGRIAAWSHAEPRGRMLLESMGRELSLFVGIQRGKETFPLDDPLLYEHRKSMLQELKGLFSISKTFIRQKHRPPSDEQIVEHFRSTIERERKSFPLLYPERVPFINMLKILLQQNEYPAARLRTGSLPPAEFYNGWVARASNRRSVEAVRQEISNLGKSIRSR